MALTGRAGGVALLGVLLVLVAPSVWTLAVVNGAIVLAICVDTALAAPVRALVISRHGDSSTWLGNEATVRLTVHNPTTRVMRALVRDAWPPSARATPARQELRVPPGARRTLTTTLRPQRRGDVRPARLTVRSVGPLGLAARQGSLEVQWTIRVLPAFPSRKLLPEMLARLQQLDGRNAARVRGEGTEFDSLREYVVGDDVRSIDWRATARSSSVVVRTWRPERDRRVVVVIDTGRTSAASVGDTPQVPRLDAILDASLLLTTLATRAGDRLELVAGDQKVRASVPPGRNVLPALVEATTPLQPALVETDMRLLVSEVLRRARQRSLVVLFTSLDAAPLEEGLLPLLPSLIRRHHVLLAAVADPAVARLADGRGDAAAVYGAAAAERVLASRQRMAQRLRATGVRVVDAPPDHLAAAVADAYLALKAPSASSPV
jgi:uncharacterized protein (DUF58 family)